MANLNLDFANRLTPVQGTRSPLAGFIQSKLRGVISQSDDANGSRPAEAFYPYRYLPVWLLDTTLDDGIVIPKGNIVSGLTTKSTQKHMGFGEVVDASSIFIGVDYSGGALSANIDRSYFGYTEHVAGLLVPANGGITCSGGNTALDQYTSLDTGRTMNPGTTALVNIAAGGTAVDVPYTRNANLPIGIVMGDVYQDIRGAHLNYQVWNLWGIRQRGYIEVPFLDLWAADTNGNGRDDTLADWLDSASLANTILPDAPWYATVARTHAFLYNPVDNVNLLQPGTLLKSDLYGKFVPEYLNVTNLNTGGFGFGQEGVTFAKTLGRTTNEAILTAQTVGRLVVTDSRFPKDMLETVTTYPGSTMPGTDTAGLPAHLYTFARDVLINSGDVRHAVPVAASILNMVQAGIFGVARIQLVLA